MSDHDEYSKHYGRRTRRYKQLREQFRTQCEFAQLPCWIDGRPIDYALPHEHPEAFNLDHAISVAQRPDLAEDPANFRPSHRRCNEARGAGTPELDIGIPSEVW